MSAVARNCAVVICTEPSFEHESRLLVRSIRRLGEEMAAMPIFSYAPRPQCKPSPDCLEEFRALGVVTIDDELDHPCPNYGLANKIIACAHAERCLGYDRIVFLDSDKIILRPPSELWRTDAPFLARPVYKKIIGASSYDDAEGEYWRELHAICGVTSQSMVRATLCGSPIFAYFNSGMFSTPTRLGLMQRWLDNFTTAWERGLAPRGGERYYLEQSSLAATVAAQEGGWRLLPKTYNVPFLAPVPSPEVLIEAVSLHYMGTLEGGGWPSLLNAAPWGWELKSFLAAAFVELGFPYTPG